MSLAGKLSDLRVLASLARGLPTEGSAAGQLASFYGPQAADYDRFRERLLQGRREMIAALDLQPGSRVIEFGAGTGRMLEEYRDRLDVLAKVDLVDLCDPLLAQARQRANGHPKVGVHHADACQWQPEQPADRVYFSYALSMIPHWYRAIDNAARCLAPGGRIGVVDFQVAPRAGSARGFRQGRLARHLWPWWFDHDGVRLGSDLLGYLEYRFETVEVRELRARLPYLPGLHVPYFLYIGRKAGKET
ncbi:MAG: class I SAM-dependent methyltransferase [Pseudomonadota bacterium]|nr:class I SAM-dependent methyltransferase [Pseudomonadota bacterium]